MENLIEGLVLQNGVRKCIQIEMYSILADTKIIA
jgi:hypothetical protein